MIAAPIVLARHSLRRMRGILLGVGLLLAAFQFLLTQVADYLLRHSAFGQLALLMPDFIRNMAGPMAVAFLSFAGIVSLGYFHPIVLGSLIGLVVAIATEPAAEAEARFVDLTLARPLTRAHLITRTLLVLAVVTIGVLAGMAAGTWGGMTCCTGAEAERPSARLILSLAASLASVMLCWAGVTLAIAVSSKRRAVAAAVAGVSALAAYLLDYLGRAWEPAASASRLSPFHYFEPIALIDGRSLNLTDVAVLVAIGVAGIVVSYLVFERRDI